MQFLTQKQQKYIVLPRQTSGNCGYVDVFGKKSDGSYSHYWSLMPEPGYLLISFACVIDDNQLLIINQGGEIRLYHLDGKQELAVSKIGATGVFGSGIYPSQNKGFILTKSLESEGIDLFEFNLDSLKTSFVQTIGGVRSIHYVTALSENRLVGYTPIGSMEGINASDGFLTIDTVERSHKLNHLRPSPSGLFPMPPVAFDPRTKTGIRPSYDPIEIIESDTGKMYLAKVLLFDLSTGKKIRNITVREFSSSELFEDEDPEYALSCFDLPSYSEDYLDVKEEFLERFEAFKFCHKEDAFWVTFQHGILRKLSLDGKIKSSLIAHPGDPDQPVKSELLRTKFDTPLFLSPDDRFLAFGKPAVSISTDSVKIKNSEQVFLISEDMILEDDCEEHSKDPEAFSWISLEVDVKTSQVDTLDLMLQKIKEIETSKDGPYFRFRFETPGSVLNEEEFIQKLAWNKELTSKGREIISTFVSFEKELWYDNSTPSLLFIMRELALTNVNDLKLLTKYIRHCGDCKAEKDHLAVLIDQVIVKYGWCNETVDVILTRGCFQPEKGLEQLEFYIVQPEFEIYLSRPEHKSYFLNHTLFKTLAEDYFSMFFPNEDVLFSAIESEDEEKVGSLLAQPLALDQIHPEYNLNPLDMAIETGNKKIIDLLKKAGAVSLNFNANMESLEIDKTINQDISIDKAMRTLLSNLHHQQEAIQKEIYDIQFNHMLNFSLSEEQSKLLENKNRELEEIQSQIKYTNLGLISLEDLEHSKECGSQVVFPEEQDIERDNNFISDQSHAYADPASSLIEIEDLGEAAQIYAFKKMKSLLHDLHEIILNQILRFNFKSPKIFISEKRFFEDIKLTESSAKALSDFIRSLTDVARQPIWYDDEVPAVFYALQKLVMFKESYVEDLISYIKSEILDKEEPGGITELIFDVYEHYGWTLMTLALAVTRLGHKQSSNGNGVSEFRIQWKKGGLDKFIRQPEIKEEFLRLLDKHCCQKRIEWLHQFIATGD